MHGSPTGGSIGAAKIWRTGAGLVFLFRGRFSSFGHVLVGRFFSVYWFHAMYAVCDVAQLVI